MTNLVRTALAWVSCLLVPWGGYVGLAASGAARGVTVPRESLLIGWERGLLGGLSAPEHLAPWMAWGPFRCFMVISYLSFYGALLGVPAVLLLRKDRPRFSRLRSSLAVAGLVGYGLYFALPVRSPYYVLPLYQTPAFTFSQTLVQHALEGGIAFLYDGFPSMHVAFAVLLAALGGTTRWRWLWLGLLVLSTLATGAHWGLDVLAGGALGAGTWWLLGWRPTPAAGVS